MSDSVHVQYWKNSINLTPVYHLSGYSRCKERTGFICSELEMAFDAGVQTNEVPAYICLTHLHNDHVCDLNKMLIDNPKNPIVFIPNNDKFEELLVTMLRSIYLASKFVHPDSPRGQDPKSKYPYRIIKLNVGESYKFKEHDSISYYVEGLPSAHGVASISFGIYEMRRRCKPEYKNLNRSEYTRMKQEGIEFNEYYKFPILCYMSDTNCNPLASPEAQMIVQYPTIVIECTFLEPDDLKHAKKKNHMHWSQLEPFVRAHPNNKFILIHFSKKYTWLEVQKFFDKYLRKTQMIGNLILWLHTGLVDYGEQKIENLNSVILETVEI